MNRDRLKATVLSLALPLVLSHCSSSSEESTDSQETTAVQTRTFNTWRVEPAEHTHSVNLTGRVVSLQKLDVVSRVQGVAQRTPKPFEAGVEFQKGEVLLALEDTDFRYNLSAQKSQFLASLTRIMSDVKLDYPDLFPAWKNYLERIELDGPLPEVPEIKNEQFRFFLAAQNILNQYYSIRSNEEVLDRYVIRAPFTGALTLAQVDPGSLVNPGMKLGEFIQTDTYEVHASVSVSELAQLQEGKQLTMSSRALAGQEWQAKVSRIGKRVDPATQAVPVYLTIQGEELREGMYLQGVLPTEELKDVVALPKNLLTRKNEVHVIQDGRVYLKSVTPVKYGAERVWIRGLQDGDEVITDEIYEPIQGIAARSQAKEVL